MSYDKWVQKGKVSKQHTSTLDNAWKASPFGWRKEPSPKQEMPQEGWRVDDVATIIIPKNFFNIIAECPQIEAPTTHKPPMALERNSALSSILQVFHPPQFLEVVLKWDSVHVVPLDFGLPDLLSELWRLYH